MRKVWKRELDGLNGKQSIAKLESILRDLGMEGRPTLEKCKSIKERREYEEELRALDPSNVLESRLRSRNPIQEKTSTVNSKIEEIDSSSSEDHLSFKRPKINFALLGDSEE